MTHICISKLPIIGSDNGLAAGRRQTIIWTNDGILLIGPLGTNFSEILIGIQTFSFKKMHLKMSSAKWRPFCLGLNVLIYLFAMSSMKQLNKNIIDLYCRLLICCSIIHYQAITWTNVVVMSHEMKVAGQSSLLRASIIEFALGFTVC